MIQLTKPIGVKAEVEIKIRSWGIQEPKGLMNLSKKLEFDK